jgi:predicted DCC family thiol-disulfide oxidoreductase YuxK
VAAAGAPRQRANMDPHGPIILYDGVCGLCNRFVQFVLRRDRRDQFRFASLQSSFARELLRRHGEDATRLDTFFLVLDPDTPSERVLKRSRAALGVLRLLGNPWRVLAGFGVLPTFLLDIGYNLVARVRYRVFGKFETCLLPDPSVREKFIEV